MHDWITINFFWTACRTHICMHWLDHYEFFLTALEHIYACKIKSLRKLFICLRLTYMHDWITTIFLTALEHVYPSLNHYKIFWYPMNTYEHDLITMICFYSLWTHICMIELLWIFFYSLRPHIRMIESLWNCSHTLRTHMCMIESLWNLFWEP